METSSIAHALTFANKPSDLYPRSLQNPSIHQHYVKLLLRSLIRINFKIRAHFKVSCLVNYESLIFDIYNIIITFNLSVGFLPRWWYQCRSSGLHDELIYVECSVAELTNAIGHWAYLQMCWHNVIKIHSACHENGVLFSLIVSNRSMDGEY